MTYQNITCEHHEGYAVITLNRPKANALSQDLMQELAHAMDALRDDHAVRCVVITGGAGKFFSGGADLASVQVQLGDLSSGRDGFIETGLRTINAIEAFPKPVIAAVNGIAVGGGCELALACHLRIAADTASFGQPEIKLGIIPGWGGTHRLPRLIGESRAMDWLLTGRSVSAQEAFEAGLVCKVVPHAMLESTTAEMAKALSYLPAVALRVTLRCVQGRAVDPAAGMDLEAEAFAEAGRSKDAAEGVAAFLEKRAPRFVGE
jgi:enoyl-CoA hydratase